MKLLYFAIICFQKLARVPYDFTNSVMGSNASMGFESLYSIPISTMYLYIGISYYVYMCVCNIIS